VKERRRRGAVVAVLLALLLAWWVATPVPLPAEEVEPATPPAHAGLVVRTPEVAPGLPPAPPSGRTRVWVAPEPAPDAEPAPPPDGDWPDFDYRPCVVAGLLPEDALEVAEFQRRHGICLRFEGRKNAKMETEPLDEELVPWSIELAHEWIAPYPPELVPDVVDEVRFVDQEKDDVSHVLGSAECGLRSMVVVVNDKREHGGVLTTMHHELAHLLSCAYPIDRKAWAAANALPWLGGSRAFRGGKGEKLTLDQLHEAGFVSSYAQASFQEDVAELYEVVTGDPDRATRLAGRFTRLDRKLRMLEDWARALPGEVVLPTDPRPPSTPGAASR
jgi:hypothetical protein